MNKNAQALALFITLIPVIFVVVMFVYESSVFVNKKSNTESILESTMMDAKKYNLSDNLEIDDKIFVPIEKYSSINLSSLQNTIIATII